MRVNIAALARGCGSELSLLEKALRGPGFFECTDARGFEPGNQVLSDALAASICSGPSVGQGGRKGKGGKGGRKGRGEGGQAGVRGVNWVEVYFGKKKSKNRRQGPNMLSKARTIAC